MPRVEYQRRLARLRADVCAMAELVLERYELALDARASGDPDLVERVRDGDHDVNRLYLDLERDCIDLLALEQPVASDLRFVAATFKIVTDLERLGDLATNLAGSPPARAGPEARDDPLADELDRRRLAENAGEMVADAMAAYEAGDAEAARAVAARDDELDAACAAASDRVVRALLAADLDAGDGETGDDGAGDDGTADERAVDDPATDDDATDHDPADQTGVNAEPADDGAPETGGDGAPATGGDAPGTGTDGDTPGTGTDGDTSGTGTGTEDVVVLGEGAAPGDDALVAAASRALLTIRDVERVGDHAVNVCARTVYAVEGEAGLLY